MTLRQEVLLLAEFTGWGLPELLAMELETLREWLAALADIYAQRRPRPDH